MTAEDVEWAEQDSLERMAEFCLSTGFPPGVYWALTQEEYAALVSAHNKKNKKGAY